jgi:hypothetical protein
VFLAPVVFLVLILIMGVAADYWLESAGGRQAIEKRLGRVLKLTVRLEGEFDLELLPGLAVSGSELRLIRPDDRVVAGAGTYALSLDFLKLISGEIDISGIELGDGFLVLPGSPGEHQPQQDETLKAGAVLPGIQQLSLENFRIFSDSTGSVPAGAPVATIGKLQIADFESGREAQLTMEAALEAASGTLLNLDSGFTLSSTEQGYNLRLAITSLNADTGELAVGPVSGILEWSSLEGLRIDELEWSGEQIGTLKVNGRLDSDNRTGKMDLKYFPVHDGKTGPESPSDDLTISMDVVLGSGQLWLPRVDIQILGQEIEGNACARFSGELDLHIHLQAEVLDIDPVVARFSGGNGGSEFPLPGVNIGMTIGRMHFRDAWAESAKIRLGNPQVCAGAESWTGKRLDSVGREP